MRPPGRAKPINFETLLVDQDATLMDELTIMAYFTPFVRGGDRAMEALNETVADQMKILEIVTGDKRQMIPSDLDISLRAMESRFEWARRWITVMKTKATFDVVLEEMRQGKIDKVVFLSRSKMSLEPLSFMCEDHYGTAKSYVSTAGKINRWGLRNFRDKKGCRFLIQRIGFPPLDLTNAHHCVVIDPSWNSIENAQAIMQLHRRGQTRPVVVRFAALRGTVDEIITQAYRLKAKLIIRSFDAEREVLLRDGNHH
jgi:hypothetical protein